MAKRGYTSDTIRGGASEWDVSRPFSSYLRLLAQLLVHPGRFFEVLPRVPDIRAPALFLGFCTALSSLLWLLSHGWRPGLAVLVLAAPMGLLLAGLCYLGTPGGRYGFTVTWRTLLYPFGFLLTLSWVPLLQFAAAVYLGGVLVAAGLRKVREVPPAMAAMNGAAVATLLVLGISGLQAI
jgi:hypothetical protein